MKLSLSNKILGTKKSILTEDFGDTFSLSDGYKKSLVIGDIYDYRNIDEYLLSQNITKNFREIIPEKYINMVKLVSKNDASFPLYSLMSESDKKQYISNTFLFYKNILENMNHEYLETYLNTQISLKLLDSYKLDNNAIDEFLQSNILESQKLLIKEIIDYQKSKNRFVYTRGSSTGRIKVHEGPNVLSLMKSLRKIFKSRYKNGKILQIDFVSHEPRVLSYLTGVDVPKDIHDFISKNVFDQKISRKEVKIAVMGILYGMSILSLAEKLGSSKVAEQALSEIKSFFKLKELEEKLKETKTDFRNFYGRKVLLSENDSFHMISRFVQSTSVDVALMGFSNLIKTIHKEKIKANPFMIIHDAIYLDCDESVDLAQLKKIKNAIEYNSKFDKKFFISIEEL